LLPSLIAHGDNRPVNATVAVPGVQVENLSLRLAEHVRKRRCDTARVLSRMSADPKIARLAVLLIDEYGNDALGAGSAP
jgi:hypothetical protein